ncbi:hypothetical protein D3C85_1914580 [compost metagenome]
MSAVTAFAGVVPSFESGARHQGSGFIDHAFRPIVGGFQRFLLLDGGTLGLGSQLGQHCATGDERVRRLSK